jgi:hypothetical protein
MNDSIRRHLFWTTFIVIFIKANDCLQTDLGNCAVRLGTVATCKSLLSCRIYPSKQFMTIEYFDFQNTIDTIPTKSFTNCTFFASNRISMRFDKIKAIEKFAFENMNIGNGVELTVRIENGNELYIDNNAFDYILIGTYARLAIEITNYRHLAINSMARHVIQDLRSTFEINLHNIDQIIISRERTTSQRLGEIQNKTIKYDTMLTKNTTYSVSIAQVKKLIIETDEFRSLNINPHSLVSISIEDVESVNMQSNTFTSLNQGLQSIFKLSISDASRCLLIGESLFADLVQDDGAEFYFAVDKIGHSIKTDSSTTYNQQTICLPKNFLANVQQARNSLVQVKFANSMRPILVNTNAFSEIELSVNSKFQIQFKSMNEHILFDEGSINRIKVLGGRFDVSVDDHGSMARTAKRWFWSSNDNDDILFQLNDKAIAHVFLTLDSYFRIGFLNSKSVFVMQPTALCGVHVDRLEDVTRAENANYRTKIVLEVKNSDRFRVNLLTDAQLPSVIEVNDYEPILNTIRSDGSLDGLTFGTFESVQRERESINANEREICRFVRAHDFLSHQNLLYFSDAFGLPLKFTGESSLDEAPKSMCSSCLFLFLYRSIHRRGDFYFVKNHLPHCFVSLFYPNIYFQNEKNSSVKDHEIANIEVTLETYWKLQNCQRFTGMKTIFAQFDQDFVDKHICSKYYRPNVYDAENSSHSTVPLKTCRPAELSRLEDSMKERAHITQTSAFVESNIVYVISFSCLAIGAISYVIGLVCRRQQQMIRLKMRKTQRKPGSCPSQMDEDRDDDAVYEVESGTPRFPKIQATYEQLVDDLRKPLRQANSLTRSIFKQNRSKRRRSCTNVSYQAMLPRVYKANKTCTKYENLLNDEAPMTSGKNELNVIYNANRNELTLLLSKTENDFNENVSLQTNPLSMI